jgi:hypothetical protein
MELFFHEATWLFSAAIGLVLALGLLESLGLLLGHGGLFGWLDHGLDAHGPDAPDAEGLFGWLHIGKVPLTILLILFLSTFGLAGFATQMLARGLLGQFLPLPLAALAAAFVALPTVRLLGGIFSRLLPKDQTFATSLDDLTGRIAVVVGGAARQGLFAQARVKDAYGAAHYVMVEPDNPAEEFPKGTEVLLLRRIGGSRFRAIPNPRPDLI